MARLAKSNETPTRKRGRPRKEESSAEPSVPVELLDPGE
jgi:AT hook motif